MTSPRPADPGGYPRRLRLLVFLDRLEHYRVPLFQSLGELGFDIAIACSQAAPSVRDEQAIKIINYQTPRWGPVRYAKLHKYVDLSSYDVVLAHFNLRWLDVLRLTSRSRGYRLVLWGIGSSSAKGFRSRPLLDVLRRGVARRADSVLVYTESAAARLRRGPFPARNVQVAHNTVWVARPEPVAAQGAQTSFVFVGSLDERKRVDELLRAFKQVSDRLPKNVRLEIVGDGPAERALRDETHNLGLNSRVVFHGRIEASDELRGILERAIASVSPGQAGLSILTSFAFGVPFITRADAITGGEIDNIIHGYNGLLYSDEHHELPGLLVMLATEQETSRRMAQAAFDHYMTRASWDVFVRAFVDAMVPGSGAHLDTDTRPAVSVCMAVHNGERFLKAQLDSIMCQLKSGDEVVVVDDGSSDNSASIVRSAEAARRDVQWVYLRSEQPNGPAAAFRSAIANATREYVVVSDQDDLWPPGRISTLVSALDGHDLVFGSLRTFGKPGPVGLHNRKESLRGFTGALQLALKTGRRFQYGSACAFRREIANLDLPVGETYEVWLAVQASLRAGVGFLPDVVTFRRLHDSNLTFKRSRMAAVRGRLRNLGLLVRAYRLFAMKRGGA